MKVNTNQKPEKEPSAKKLAEQNANGGNVYKEAFKGYADKLRDGSLFAQNKFWIVVCAVLFLVFLSVNSNGSNAKTQLTVQLKRTASEITKLNGAIEEVKADLEEQARIDSVKLTQEEEELARNNAIEQGVYVATLQNAYRSLDLATNYDAFTNNKNQLDACFGSNDKNARVEWYSSVSGIPGKWEFVSKASFSGDAAKVLWLCYADEDHTLLAYCTAKYNAGTKLFTNVEWKLTSYAMAHIGTDTKTDNNGEQITSIPDALKNLAGEENPIAPDGFSEETIQNNNEVSETRDSYKDSAANG